jgi:DNA-binding NarL/FixJ family response regulator
MQRAKRYSVLLVDDELINIKILSDVLKDDYEVIFATGAQEGIYRAIESKPDIILLDIMMPGMDGYEACARLQSDPRTAGIPVIFVTALGSTAQEVKGLDTGAVDYVTKPINAEIVKARVRNHLKYKNLVLASSIPEQFVDHAMESMTDRQREIFEWVKKGKTNWEIAKIIGCSQENVKYHMKNILRVLGSYNRTQAAASHPLKPPDSRS